MPIPSEFLNFPGANDYTKLSLDFNHPADLMPWEWTFSGHNPPDTLDTASSRVQLGSGDATSGSYLNGQTYGGGVLLNRTNKLFEVEFLISLSSATLCECMIGLNATNVNMLNTCVADGFGLYINGPSGPAAGTWHVYSTVGAVTQYTDYQGYSTGVAGDTNTHTFGIRVQTDANTLGTGSIVYFMDGVQVGNGISGAGVLTQQPLRLSIAMGNASGAAQSVLMYRAGYLNQR